MATIDKIYLGDADALLFTEWLNDHRRDITDTTGRDPFDHYYNAHYTKEERVAAKTHTFNFPLVIDWYLMQFCEIEPVIARLKEQYLPGDWPHRWHVHRREIKR